MKRARATLAVLAVCAVGAAARAQQADGLSNPLWSMTLDQLAATRDRPVFTQSRRPPPLAAAPEGPQTVVVGDSAPPPFALVGTVVGESEKFAVLLESGSQTVLRLPLGASASGWNVAEVAPRSIKLTRGGHSVTLELPKPFPR
ncbi:MAG TPA: hypothetical protein PKA55_10435 [Rhodoblastus sp.]|nr:hypothetical protein [Rhodoblastus sp.]